MKKISFPLNECYAHINGVGESVHDHIMEVPITERALVIGLIKTALRAEIEVLEGTESALRASGGLTEISKEQVEMIEARLARLFGDKKKES